MSSGMLMSALALASFIACFMAVPVVNRLATHVGLVDRPDSRKLHIGDIPLTGGICIYIVMVTALAVLYSFSGTATPAITLATIVLAITVLVAVGVLDDLFDISPYARLASQILVVGIAAYFGGVRVESLGNILGPWPVEFSVLGSTVFTTFCVIGVINAVNMLDGLDGLVGSVVLVTAAVLTPFAVLSGMALDITMCIVLIATLLAYLLFNLSVFGKQQKIFLGDSGSMIVGLTLSVLFVRLSGPESAAFPAVAAGWLLGLPLLDAVAVITRRVFNRASPVSAGRDHLHHMLQRAGFTAAQTVWLMLSMHIVMVAVGLLAVVTDLPDWAFFWAFVVLTLLHIGFAERTAQRLANWVLPVTAQVQANAFAAMSDEQMEQPDIVFPDLPKPDSVDIPTEERIDSAVENASGCQNDRSAATQRTAREHSVEKSSLID